MRMFAMKTAATETVQADTSNVDDVQTWVFFAQLRQYLGLSHGAIAERLQTTASVIVALETGLLADLPPWLETRQVVMRYAALAGIDPAPILHCLSQRFNASADAQANEGVARTTITRDGDDERLASKQNIPVISMPWMSRRFPIFRTAIVGVGFAILGLGTQSSAIEAAMTKLPAPFAKAMRKAQDAVLIRVSAKFEGMAWINVENPRSRRSDKLPTVRR